MSVVSLIQDFDLPAIDLKSSIYCMTIGILFWGLIFLALISVVEIILRNNKIYQSQSQFEKNEYLGYCFSFTHSLICSLIGVYFVFLSCKEKQHSFLSSSTCQNEAKNVTSYILMICSGYFIVDLGLLTMWYEQK